MFSSFYQPEVHYVVFMVSSVQVHVVGVKQQVGEQEDDHFDGLFPTVHKVPIKHIWRLRRGKAILNNSNMPEKSINLKMYLHKIGCICIKQHFPVKEVVKDSKDNCWIEKKWLYLIKY